MAGKRLYLRRLLAWLLLMLLVLGGWGLRLYQLDRQSIWYDEAVSIQNSSAPFSRQATLAAHDNHPPLHAYLLWLSERLSGRSAWSARFLSAWSGFLLLPLLFAFGRRWFGEEGGLLALLSGAASPLLVYYAQEARMYALVTALAAATLWLFIRWLHRGPACGRCWLGTGFLLLGALYAHYSAFLLLPLFYVALLWRWRRDNDRRWLWQGGKLTLLLLLGYLPWAVVPWQRAEQAHGYLQGILQWHLALRAWLENFTWAATETVLEPVALRFLLVFLLIFFLSLAALLWETWRQGKVWRWFFLAGWLFLPPFFLFLMAYRVPKFHPRYLLVSYPAWLLLQVGGLLALWHWPRRFTFLGKGVVAASLFFLLGTNSYALHNWFTDPAFSKPDFRGAVTYLQVNRAPDEPVLLLSGHMRPAVAYYAPGLPVIPLPDAGLLNVNKIIRPDVVQVLNEKVAGHAGVWLLLWQDDIVDPNGIVSHLLARQGREMPVSASFWHLRLRHFRLPRGVRFQAVPAVSLDVLFARKIALVGYTQRKSDEVTLYYRALQPLSSDVKISYRLLDGEGNLWGEGDRRPAGYNDPAFRWQPGELVPGYIALPAGPGTPAGEYHLALRLYDTTAPHGWDALAADGHFLGKEVFLPVKLSRPRPATAADLLADAQAVPAMGMTVAPAYWQLVPPSGEAGQRLHLDVWWKGKRSPLPTDRWRWMLRSSGGEEVAGPWRSLTAAPALSWTAADLLHTQAFIRLPRQEGVTNWRFFLSWQGSAGVVHERELAILPLQPGHRVFHLPPLQIPVSAEFGGRLFLAGVNGLPQQGHPGEKLTLTLAWQAVREMDRSWTGFVHLLGPDGRVVSQDDCLLGGERHMTASWFAGEVVITTFRLAIPITASPGSAYRLEVGVYDAGAPGLPRLPRSDAGAKSGETVSLLPWQIVP